MYLFHACVTCATSVGVSLLLRFLIFVHRHFLAFSYVSLWCGWLTVGDMEREVYLADQGFIQTVLGEGEIPRKNVNPREFGRSTPFYMSDTSGKVVNVL